MMSKRMTIRSFNDDRRGTVAMTFALTAIGLFGIVGLAIDYGRAMNSVTRMRGALDAAVLASSNVPVDQQVAIAKAYFAANFTDSFAAGTTVPQFSVNSSGGLSGAVTAFVDTTFGKILGIDNLPVAAVSSAKPNTATTTTTATSTTVTVPGATPCIHVQDQNNTSFKLDSNSNLDMSACEVHVRSNSSIAMQAISNSNVKFKRVWVKGGVSSTGGITIIDSPYVVQTNAAVVGDPYSAAVNSVRNLVSVGTCTAANTDKKYSGVTVQPGTYCGSIEFNNVTFASGLYIINDASGSKAGALKLTGLLDGSASVTFYLAGNKTAVTQYNASEESVLTAPTSGITRGLLFFEASNRGNTWPFTLQSSNKQSWTGLVYLPSANMTLNSLSEWPKFNVGFVVNQMTMKSLSSIIQNYVWTPYGYSAPIFLPDETKTVSSTATTTEEKSKYLLH